MFFSVVYRTLKQKGYEPVILYPKRTERPIFKNLVTQCEMMDIKFVDSFPVYAADGSGNDNNGGQRYGLIVDAIFGFSFSGKLSLLFKC